MSSYKLVIPPMTIHFCEDYPMRKKPVMAVSFEGENCQYKEFSDSEYGEGVKCGLADAREYIKIAPTIIPADGGTE